MSKLKKFKSGRVEDFEALRKPDKKKKRKKFQSDRNMDFRKKFDKYPIDYFEEE